MFEKVKAIVRHPHPHPRGHHCQELRELLHSHHYLHLYCYHGSGKIDQYYTKMGSSYVLYYVLQLVFLLNIIF